MRTPRSPIIAVGVLTTVAVVLVGVGVTTATATGPDDRRVRMVEVAETGSRFVSYPDLVDAGGVPTRGNYFVTEGYIYRQGAPTCQHVQASSTTPRATRRPSSPSG
ncbi:MAG: hypothetical protein ACRD0A_08460 [Acidimicrobiales bacterium]